MASQYKSILKATSIFGGTQFLQILVNLIKAKFVAILIGPAGVGLSSLYMSTMTMVITIFGLGIHYSVVRNLSKANDEKDMDKFSVIVAVFRKLLMIEAILGMLFTISCSSWLSDWAFKSTENAVDYALLSLVVLFTLLIQGNTAVLIGKREVKKTALCTLFGSIVNLLTSIPIFYFWGLKGIVPGLIISSLANYLITSYYFRTIKVPKVNVNFREVILRGKDIVTLGITMVIASLMGNATTYLINLGINRMGGLSDLGYYNAAISMTTQVVTLIFASMASDYYPRLVASFSDRSRMIETVNQQCEVNMYLSLPILLFFMILSPLAIKILLTSDFMVLVEFIRIICIGMMIRAIAYSMGYVSFAKGDKLAYLLLEGGIGNLLKLFLAIFFYYIWGLKGLSYAYLLNLSLYLIVIYFFDKYRYGYMMSSDVKKNIIYSVSSLSLILVMSIFLYGVLFYIVSIIVASLLSIRYLNILNQKTGLLQVFKSKITLKRNKYGL